jgi:ribosomal protein S8
MSGHLISHAIAGIKLAHQQNRIFCMVKKSKHMLRFLSVLRANCFIYGYACIPASDLVYVYLRYHKSRPVIRGLKQVSRPGHKRYITYLGYSNLTVHSHPGTTYIVNSSFTKGILQQVGDAEVRFPNFIRKYKCGELLCVVW